MRNFFLLMIALFVITMANVAPGRAQEMKGNSVPSSQSAPPADVNYGPIPKNESASSTSSTANSTSSNASSSASARATVQTTTVKVPGKDGKDGGRGTRGSRGSTGRAGHRGVSGTDGANGNSAYQIARHNGFKGSKTVWLASLKGVNGDSAYQVAVSRGFSGSKDNWLESLKGDTGPAGPTGPEGREGKAYIQYPGSLWTTTQEWVAGIGSTLVHALLWLFAIIALVAGFIWLKNRYLPAPVRACQPIAPGPTPVPPVGANGGSPTPASPGVPNPAGGAQPRPMRPGRTGPFCPGI